MLFNGTVTEQPTGLMHGCYKVETWRGEQIIVKNSGKKQPMVTWM